MTDTASALDSYLSTTYGIGLERALLDATAGIASLALRRGAATTGAVEIACDPVGRHVYDDEGVSDRFRGTIACEGVTYRFTCVTFTDAGGARYLETIGPLEPVGWGVRLAIAE